MILDLEARNHVYSVNLKNLLKEIEGDVEWFRRCMEHGDSNLPIDGSCILDKGKAVLGWWYMLLGNQETIDKLKSSAQKSRKKKEAKDNDNKEV